LLNGLANQLSGAWWSYPLIFGLAYADVLFPLVSSETTVIAGSISRAISTTDAPLGAQTADVVIIQPGATALYADMKPDGLLKGCG